MTYTTHAGERGGPVEVWQHDADHAVRAMWRRKDGAWQFRDSFGTRWCRVASVPPPVAKRIAAAEVGLGSTGEAA